MRLSQIKSKSQQKAHKKRYQQLKQQGLCTYCGKKPATKTLKCDHCRQKGIISQWKLQEQRKQRRLNYELYQQETEELYQNITTKKEQTKQEQQIIQKRAKHIQYMRNRRQKQCKK